MDGKEIDNKQFKLIRKLLIDVKHGLRYGQVQRKDRKKYQHMLQDAIDILERLSKNPVDSGYFIVLIEDFLDGYGAMMGDKDRYGILEELLMDQIIEKLGSWSEVEKKRLVNALGKERWNNFLEGLDQIADLDKLGLKKTNKSILS